MFLQKKIAIIIFPILWFVIVGLRYEVGTDWYPTLELFDRAVLNAKSFNSYQLVDTEILWKIVATVSESFKISKSYILIFIGFVEALLIFHLIKISENYRLAIVGITSVFLFFFPMNAMRQGFCLIALVASFSKVNKMKLIGNILAFTSHLSSVPLLLALKTKIEVRYLILLIIPFLIGIYFIQDLILIRYVDIYGSLGFSPRLALQTILTIFLILMFDNSNAKYKYLILILFFYFSTYLIFFSYRYVGFLCAFYILYYGIYYKPNDLYKTLIFLVASFTFLFSDLSDISRAAYASDLNISKECFKCTPWIPYNNYIFDLLK